MSLSIIITIEIFIALLGLSAYFLYSLLLMNKNLRQQKEALLYRLKDVNSRLNGMRVQIQKQNSEIKRFKIASKNKPLEKSLTDTAGGPLSIEQMKRQKRNADQAAEHEKKKRVDLENMKSALQNQLKQLEKKIENEKKSRESGEKLDKSYKELFYDLKNSIAYNMTGGDHTLDILRKRLIKNGNVEASQELDALKERYNQLGEMVGLVSEVEIYDEADDIDETKAELMEIENAESLVDEMDKSLEKASSGGVIDTSNLEFTKEQMEKIVIELENTTEVKNNLAQNLDKTANQLRAFIAKAHMFQSQKEQIRLHKGTEKRLHQNIANISNDYSQLGHRYKALESKLQLDNQQANNDESLEKLNQLKDDLEIKEDEMLRLNLEKDMVVQQFMALSKEADTEADSSQSLKLLESEHKLLEQQFFEILKELEAYEKE